MPEKVLIVFEYSPKINLGLSNTAKGTKGNAIVDFNVLSLDFIKAIKDKLTSDLDIKTGTSNSVTILNCIVLEKEKEDAKA